jgi:ADP-heptose:LPS heptosyltransferase
MNIACSHPGKIGDALYALPTIRLLSKQYGVKVDFYTSSHCSPLKRLFEYQHFIDKFIVSDRYTITHFGCGVQPRYIPIEVKRYSAVFQLGFQYTPNIALHRFIAQSVNITDKELRIEYEFPRFETLDEPYIIVAPGKKYKELFKEFISKSPILPVVIGSTDEYNGVGKDLTGLDMLETLTWISKAKAFVGIMSSQLALANGFNIPKIVPYIKSEYDMRHVVYSDKHFYLENPTVESILEKL